MTCSSEHTACNPNAKFHHTPVFQPFTSCCTKKNKRSSATPVAEFLRHLPSGAGLRLPEEGTPGHTHRTQAAAVGAVAAVAEDHTQRNQCSLHIPALRRPHQYKPLSPENTNKQIVLTGYSDLLIARIPLLRRRLLRRRLLPTLWLLGIILRCVICTPLSLPISISWGHRRRGCHCMGTGIWLVDLGSITETTVGRWPLL